MAYKQIESYGVIGDMYSLALVGMDGSIDWCCLPRFDSPSVFGAILDDQKGGFFKISATHRSCQCRQMYLPETNILITRFLSPDGVGEIVDFMPVTAALSAHGKRHELIRIVRGVTGQVAFLAECRPAFDYARAKHELHIENNRALFSTPAATLSLTCPYALTADGADALVEFTLGPNESATFVISLGGEYHETPQQLQNHGDEALHETIALWKQWVAKCRYEGRWREVVVRSALALKLLTYAPTGAIAAAATCSLPEEIGGVRNWDYRYTWIRDSAFTINAFLRLGYTDEAAAFMNWLQQRATEPDTTAGPLQTLYGVDGRSDLTEITLDHLDGYRGSKPVRIGNRASQQLQLDIYGELVDSIYVYDKHGTPISYDLWIYLRRILDWVCANWDRPDHGIWEVRREPEHFVYSKVQCWIALDRGLRIARKRGLPLNRERLRNASDSIYESIMQRGWNPERRAFTQYFGGTALDASVLTFPTSGFVSPTDPRMLSTLQRVREELVSDSLVHRYELGRAVGDGIPGFEGTFSICTFWMVEALSRAARLDEARFVFETMLTYANHLGLYAEEIGPTGEALGNFPQALTHLGLINAAFELDRALGSRKI
jgi:GH15 family glucan-1,4-alpha-glucosidase